MLYVDIYRENILGPREEMLKEKREAEFYKFNSTWRGRGQRLRVNHLCDSFFVVIIFVRKLC